MATNTVRKLIRRAMMLGNIVAVNETPNGAEIADALDTLNDMIDSWATERLMVFAIRREVLALTPALQTHTLGAGGSLNLARPSRIEHAGIIVSSSELPIRLLTVNEWATISIKSTTGIPNGFWDDGAFPLRNLAMWPIPDQAYSLALYVWSVMAQFATVDEEIAFAPGYGKALRYNLAVELAAEYGKDISPAVVANAIASKAAIKSFNSVSPVMDIDSAIVGSSRYDIRTG